MGGVRLLAGSGRTREGKPPGKPQQWRNSPEFFERLYEVHRPALQRYFVRGTQDVQSGLDLTAETFAKAYEKRQSFRGDDETQGAAWVWAIARNELARFRRSRRVELRALERLCLERPEPRGATELEQHAGLQAARKRVGEAVASLPRSQQLVIALRFSEDLDAPSVGSRLDMPNDAVRARLSRAYRTLRVSPHVLEAIAELETLN